MRCDYCYNGDIVFSKGHKSLDEVLAFLKKRIGMLEAVVLSGGEATAFNGLLDFAKDIKKLGYKIKLDTNGTYPLKIQELLDEEVLDYIALDYKAPQSKFYEITKNQNFSSFTQSLDLLISSNINFEVRTTLHNDLLNEDDINEIIFDLDNRSYKNTYYIQNFVKDVKTIGDMSNPEREFDKTKLSDNLHVEFRT
jgi:pyruvate formate lyase activating enzyme